MKYLCLIYDEEKKLSGMSQGESDAFMGEYFAFTEGIRTMDGQLNPRRGEDLAQWRTDAVNAMVEQARKQGANAVIGMRFDAGTGAEICAYGTAVRAERARLSAVPSPDEARSGSGARSVSGTPGRWPPTSAETSTYW